MINEASIIPYTQNWKELKVNKQNNHYDLKSEFELSLYYHLDMVLQDGGDLDKEIDKMIEKYPNQNIDKNKILKKFIRQINE